MEINRAYGYRRFSNSQNRYQSKTTKVEVESKTDLAKLANQNPTAVIDHDEEIEIGGASTAHLPPVPAPVEPEPAPEKKDAVGDLPEHLTGFMPMETKQPTETPEPDVSTEDDA